MKNPEEYKLIHSVNDYRQNNITLSRAAEMAGISLHEFISIMPEENLLLHYSVEDLEEDLNIPLSVSI